MAQGIEEEQADQLLADQILAQKIFESRQKELSASPGPGQLMPRTGEPYQSPWPTVLGVGAGLAAGAFAPATLGVGLPGVLAAGALGGVATGAITRGVEDVASEEVPFHDYDMSTALFDGATGMIPAGAFELGARALKRGVGPILSSKKPMLNATLDDLPEHIPLEQRMPGMEKLERAIHDTGTLQSAESLPIDQIPDAILPGEVARLHRVLAANPADKASRGRLNVLQQKLDEVVSTQTQLRNDPTRTTAEEARSIGKSVGEFTAGFSSPTRTLRKLSSEGHEIAGRAGGKQEITKVVAPRVEQHFNDLLEQVHKYTPPSSPLRDDLRGFLVGQRNLDELGDVEQELFSRIKEGVDELDAIHQMSDLMVSDLDDMGRNIFRPYESRGNYSPDIGRGASDEFINETTELVRRQGGMVARQAPIPEEAAARSADEILSYIGKKHSQTVANEIAYGGDKVRVSFSGQIMEMPALYLQQLLEMSGGDLHKARMMMWQQAQSKFGNDAMNKSVARGLSKIRNVTGRLLLPNNWTVQLAEASKGLGYAGGFKNYARGRKWAEANPDGDRMIRETASAVKDNILAQMDGAADDFWVPATAQAADRLSRQSSIHAMQGRVMDLAEQFKGRLDDIASGGKIREIDRLKVREIAPEAMTDDAVRKVMEQYAGELQKHGTITATSMRDGVDELMTRVFHTYTAETVAPMLRDPVVGQTILQFRHFSANAAGMFAEDVLRPMWKAGKMMREGVKSGNRELVGEAKEVIGYAMGKAGGMSLYSAAPLAAHRGFRMLTATNASSYKDFDDFKDQWIKNVMYQDMPGAIGGIIGDVAGGFARMSGEGDARQLMMQAQLGPMASAPVGKASELARAERFLFKGEFGKAGSNLESFAKPIAGSFMRRSHGAMAPLVTNSPELQSPLMQALLSTIP